MNPIQVLRDATAFRTVASLNAYPEALAQVEALVEAARIASTWVNREWGTEADWDRLHKDQATIENALAPFQQEHQ